jgi:hypothetical protein
MQEALEDIDGILGHEEGIEVMDVCNGGTQENCCIDCSWVYRCKKNCERAEEDYKCPVEGTDKCLKKILNIQKITY